MVKYKIRKEKYHPDMFTAGYDFEVVSKKNLPIKLKMGWEIVSEDYFIITKACEFWKTSKVEEKSLVVAIFSLFVAVLALLVALYK